MNIPKEYQTDVDKALEILSKVGCTEIFLFGSVAQGCSQKNSDLDFAVKGCPPERFFSALGSLLMELDHSVDLVDLDDGDRFSSFLQGNEELVLVS
ncbi:MAG: nucleotidyltransferase domain-containing protein [Spirochaetaceae bacterium]|jgi:predicted nucleotidyltransferase|nr:nucleotidyltransferase domain-containing protein [Spirochaetaceae bacterium]